MSGVRRTAGERTIFQVKTERLTTLTVRSVEWARRVPRVGVGTALTSLNTNFGDQTEVKDGHERFSFFQVKTSHV